MLVDQYSQAQCQANNGTPPGSGSGQIPQAQDVWWLLALPWADWNQTAQEAQDFGQWTKAQWKAWISNFVLYETAYQQYLLDQDLLSLTGNASANMTAYEYLNFADIWVPAFDSSSVTVSSILNQLN